MQTERAYVEWKVRAEPLADRLVCTWQDATAADDSHAVLPDACIDLVWDGARVVVAGPDTRPWSSRGGVAFVGLRFRPGAAPGFLGVPASELVNRSVPLAELWGDAAADLLAERLAEAGADAPLAFEQAVLERFSRAAPPDPVVAALLHALRRREASVSDAADELGLSPRSLHRRATEALGYGPKTLDRILRFRRALQLVERRIALADVALCAGYSDQAHMSNEFRALGGATPRQLARAAPLVPTATAF